jgi:4-hydroxybenzoate polyprenyltransferase
LNPEKSSRPIASGKVRVITAIFIALFLLISSLLAAFWLDIRFFGAVLVLFVLSQLYSFWLKHQLFIDVIVIATNMTIRAVSGAFLVRLYVSPWLIVCVFFLAIFLALGKRHSEVLFLGENAHAHKKILGSYSKELTSSLMVISTTLLLMSYSLYSFMSGHHYLFATLPFALYVVFKYYHHIITGSQVARHTELIVKDWQMMIGVLLWIVGTIGGLYFA